MIMTYIEEAKTLTIQYLQRSPERMERMGNIRLYLQRNGSSALLSKVNNVGWPKEFKQLLKQSWNGIFSLQGRNVFLIDGLAIPCLAFTQNKDSNKRGEQNAHGKQTEKEGMARPLKSEESPKLLKLRKQLNSLPQDLKSKLEENCSLVGLKYPQELHILMSRGVHYFNINTCSVRAQNVILRALRESQWTSNDIENLADTDFFQIQNLFNTKNLGRKTVIELIQVSLGIDNGKVPELRKSNEKNETWMDLSQQKNSQKKMQPFQTSKPTSANKQYVNKLDINTRNDLKKVCAKLNLDFPRDLDVLLTRGIHYFSLDVCSVRARNILISALKKKELSDWEIESLADLRFFQLPNLFNQRKSGTKTVSELIRLGLSLDNPNSAKLRENGVKNDNLLQSPHSKFILNFIEDGYKMPKDSFSTSFQNIVYGMKSHYWSLNEIYRHQYGISIDPSGCAILMYVLASRPQNSAPNRADDFTASMLNDINQGYNSNARELRSKWAKITDNAERDFLILIHVTSGITLHDIGIAFDLTRERVRQISVKELRKFRNAKNYSETHSIIESAILHESQDQNVITFLASLYNVKDNKDLKNKTDELRELKKYFKLQPHTTLEEVTQELVNLNLIESLHSPELFETLKVSIIAGQMKLISKTLMNSPGAISIDDIRDIHPGLSRAALQSLLHRMMTNTEVIAIGRKGLYLSKNKTSLTTHQLTAAGFVEFQTRKNPKKIWSFTEILELYTLETGTQPILSSFRTSVIISKFTKEANLEIFFGRFIIDTFHNKEKADLFKSCNDTRIRSNCIHLNWDKMQIEHIPQVAFNLAQKLGESAEILELYIQDIFSEKQRELRLTSLQSRTDQTILSDLEKIAQNSPTHSNPLSVIYTYLKERNKEHDFQACSDILFHLREKQLWLE